MTGINRRQLLIRSGALTGAVWLPGTLALLPGASAMAATQAPTFFSAFTEVSGRHYLALLAQDGRVLHQVAAPTRGHSACVSSDQQRLACFARRPGRWLMLMNPQTGQILAQAMLPEGRHFNGHGVFSADNTHLFVTENDYLKRRGVIGVYATATLKRVQEFSSGGIDPHELALLADGRTLVVANGGIETHPDFERRKLNLSSMAPNLAYIDILSGKTLEHHAPPHHQLSLRHLAVTADDSVIVGAQYEGPADDDRALVFMHRRGEALRPLAGQPLAAQRNLSQYIASVTCCPTQQWVLTSAPRGNRVSVWNLHTATWVRDLDVPDVGGIAAVAKGHDMLLSSGTGTLYQLSPHNGQVTALNQQPQLQWDNHLLRLMHPT